MLTERNAQAIAPDAPTILEPRLHDAQVGVDRSGLGQVPLISVMCAAGFAVVAAGDYASRAQLAGAEALFWIGITVLVLPPLVRLLGTGPSRTERIGLVVVVAIGLYLVKVAYSPNAFTFSDELAHEYNALQVLETGHLFQHNPVLAVTALYPGLAGATAALASTTGLSDFQSGLVIVGASRILLLLTLFLLVERLTGSARIGSLAAVLYTANPNYLFWSAEYGYEPFALPLGAVVLFAALRRADATTRRLQVGWTLCAVIPAMAVVITHHVTSYALLAALWGLVIISLLPGTRARPTPWDLAIIMSAGVAAWFVLVASPTWVYLTSFLGLALVSVVRLLTLQQLPRQVFESSGAAGSGTPLWQELLALGSVALTVLGLPFGLVQWWKRSRRQSVALLLGVAGAAYVPLQVLRLTPASWETANRSSEFLFLGVAFLLALAVVAVQPRRPVGAAKWMSRVGLSAYLLVIFLGGVVVSWRPDLRLPRAYLTQTMGLVVQPEGVAVAEWAGRFLGPHNSLATDDSNALLLATYGGQYPWSGASNGIQFMLFAPTVDSGVRTILTGVGARYVVVDRRLQSQDHLVGIFPLSGGAAAQPEQYMDATAFAKFDTLPNASRIADTGDIVVYDVSNLVSGSH